MLNAERGRYVNIERNQRKCVLCVHNDIEDEYHFVLICPKYNGIRKNKYN